MLLKELAVRYEGSQGDLTQEQFDQAISKLKSDTLIRKLSETLLLYLDDNTYFLKDGDLFLSFCIVSPKKEYLNLEFIAGNPLIKNGGIDLFWSLFITLEKDILIGGAFSKKGEKFIQKFMKRNHNSEISDYAILDTKTFEKLKLNNFEDLFKRNSYAMIIPCSLIQDKTISENQTWYVFEQFENISWVK